MVDTVTPPVAVGGSGNTYSSGNDPVTGMGGGGFRRLLLKLVQDIIGMAQFVATQGTLVAGYALTALNAASTNATSVTSLSLTDTGTISLTLDQTGKDFTVGMTVGIARTSAPSNQMIGVIQTFNPTTKVMTVAMLSKSATAGPFTDWTIFRTASAGGIPATRSISAGGLATGGGDLSANRTVTVTAASAAEVAAGASSSVAVTPAALAGALVPQTLTDAATVNWDMGLKLGAKVTLGGNRTLAAPTNPDEGQTYSLQIIQDGTGSRLLTFNTCYKFGAAGTPVLSTGAGKRDLLTLYCYDAATPAFRAVFSRDA